MTSLLMVMVTGVPVSWLVQCVRLSLLSEPGLQDLEKMKSWELLKVHYSHLVDHLWPFCHVIGSIQTQRRMKFNVFYLNFSFTVRLEITGTDDRNQPFLVSWDECQSWQCLVSVRSTLTALPLARGKRFWRSARRTTGVNGSTLIRASTGWKMTDDSAVSTCYRRPPVTSQSGMSLFSLGQTPPEAGTLELKDWVSVEGRKAWRLVWG